MTSTVHARAGLAALTVVAGLARGSFALPGQQQGEGIAAGRHGVLFLCSEGVRQPVLRMLLPAGLRRAVEAATPGV